MSKLQGLRTLSALALFSVTFVLAQAPQGGPAPAGKAAAAKGPAFRMTSSSWPDGAEIPAKYTMAGGSTSPALEWSYVPAGTLSFLLLCHDPDVALQRKLDDVTHWIAWNIPATVSSLPEGVKEAATQPDGTVQGKNQRGANAYMGPGAPATSPMHHYMWEIYALDIKLDIGPDAPRADVMKAIDGHILSKAIFTGRYHQPAAQ